MPGHQKHWDETMSPQWRYLLSGESKEKKARRKLEELLPEGEGVNANNTKRLSKKARKEQKKKVKEEKSKKNNDGLLLTKSGKPIVFSASPDNTRGISRYTTNNDELPKPREKIILPTRLQ